MSFQFQWGPFSPELVEKAKGMIQEALNKGSKPSTIADTIYVNQLHIGTKASAMQNINEMKDRTLLLLLLLGKEEKSSSNW